MKEDPNLLICYIANRKTTMVSIYIDNIFIPSKYFNIINNLIKLLSQNYSVKDSRKVQTIIK